MATYREGNRGSGVASLQSQLRQAGYDIAADGIYGPQTAAAVRDFQAKNGLTVDAIAGSQTIGALRNIQAAPAVPAATVTPASADAAYASIPDFSYDPRKDQALQQDIKATSLAVMEQANERGILYGTPTGEAITQSTIGLTGNYRQQAYDRYLGQVNMRRQEINDAMTRVQTLGYVDNYTSKILGISPGTPSYQAQKDANDFQQQLALMEADYKFQKKYSQANSYTGEITFPVTPAYTPKSPGSPELVPTTTFPIYRTNVPAWERR
jgi:peptidoglycan hydrolase-like protein with peptidoglycan-binding domain